MSRLIDADEYEKRIKPYDTEDVMDKALYNFAHDHLVTTPTAQPEYTDQDVRDAFNDGYRCGMESVQPNYLHTACAPLAQPETHDKRTETHACDLIDRRKAIEAIRIFYADQYALVDSIEEQLEKLPSVQPEIIRCRECKHMQKDEIFHQCWCNGNEVKEDHFCSYAERRQDETNSRNKTC